jgi:integrase
VGRPSSGSARHLPSGQWQARVTHLGQQLTIGAYPSRQEALDAIAEVRSGDVRGRFIDPTRGRTRIEVLAEQWWLTRAGQRVSTRFRDRAVLDHHLLPELGQAQLIELTHEEVQAWVNRLALRLAPSSVQRSFTVLRQLFDFAVDNRLLSVNPSERIVLPRRKQFEARFLTPDELELLAATIDPRSRAMVLVMAWGTLRIGETMGLRRIDLDLSAGRLRVANNLVEVAGRRYEGPPKTKAGRRSMTLPPSVVADLRLHVVRYVNSSHVFSTATGGTWSAEDWRCRVWRPAVNKTGLAPLRPHDLKHTGVALLAAAGVDPSEIARRAGHSSVSFTYDRYGHLFPEVDSGAAAKLDAIRNEGLDGIGGVRG